MIRALLAAASALTLSACAVGPDFVSPAPRAPAQAGFVGGQSPAFTGDQPPGDWWRLYNDPLLDSLIQQALINNTDLRVAAANLRQARAVLRESRAGRLPTTNISAGATYGQQSSFGGGQDMGGTPGGGQGVSTGASDFYDVGLDVGYQLDLFGRIGRAIEASRAEAEAAQAAVDVARITVAAETARAYGDVCGAGRQLAVARATVAVQQETFDLTRRLLEGGRGTALETGQAGSLLEQSRAAIPTLEAQRRTSLYRLSVLTGQPPASFPQAVAGCAAPPVLTSPIPVGDGAGLLARRPDIRAADRRLAAATARIGVATAELYPSISLGAGIGSSATSPGGLFSNDGFRFSIGPLISWSFPNVAVARARIAQAEAGADAALADYDGVWLGALEETESALTRYASEGERVATLRRAVAQGRDAARIARLRFNAGREGFQVVLDAERSAATAEAALAQSEAQLSTNLVSLFLALGGGWETAPPVVR